MFRSNSSGGVGMNYTLIQGCYLTLYGDGLNSDCWPCAGGNLALPYAPCTSLTIIEHFLPCKSQVVQAQSPCSLPMPHSLAGRLLGEQEKLGNRALKLLHRCGLSSVLMLQIPGSQNWSHQKMCPVLHWETWGLRRGLRA